MSDPQLKEQLDRIEGMLALLLGVDQPEQPKPMPDAPKSFRQRCQEADMRRKANLARRHKS